MKCNVFAQYEDELFQQMSIMGMSLRRIEHSTRLSDVRKYAVIGTQAATKADHLLTKMRQTASDHCSN